MPSSKRTLFLGHPVYVFSKFKAYNVAELLDILLNEYGEHFKKKLIDIGNARIDNNLTSKSRYAGKNKSSFTADQVIEVGDKLFMVESESNSDEFYSVDMR